MKCYNWLFQYCQDQHFWTSYVISFHLVASTNISSTHLEVEDMKIDDNHVVEDFASIAWWLL